MPGQITERAIECVIDACGVIAVVLLIVWLLHKLLT
jgi:hypothetical protein